MKTASTVLGGAFGKGTDILLPRRLPTLRALLNAQMYPPRRGELLEEK